jgi:hypothetical protein
MFDEGGVSALLKKNNTGGLENLSKGLPKIIIESAETKYD